MPANAFRIIESAYRHNIDEVDIIRAWDHYVKEFVEGDDPLKVIRIGFDSHARLLEIGGHIYQNKRVKIFHAMPARRRYTERIF